MNKREIKKSIKFFQEHIQSPFSIDPISTDSNSFVVNLEDWGIFRVDYLNDTIYYPDAIRYINGEPRTFCFEWSKIKPTTTFNSLNQKTFTTNEDILEILDGLYIEVKKAKQIELEHKVRRDFK